MPEFYYLDDTVVKQVSGAKDFTKYASNHHLLFGDFTVDELRFWKFKQIMVKEKSLFKTFRKNKFFLLDTLCLLELSWNALNSLQEGEAW